MATTLTFLKQSSAKYSLVALTCLAIQSYLFAQQAPAKTAAVPTVTSNVDEVSMDVVVRKKNKPVTTLKPEDLTLTDNGTPVRIADMRLVTGAAASGRNIALVFDRMDSSAAGNARDLAAKILKQIPSTEGFTFCVLGIGGRLRLFENFTSDRRHLTQAIRDATEDARDNTSSESETAEKNLLAIVHTGADTAGTQVTPEERLAAKSILEALQDSQRVIQEQHTTMSLAGLLALSRAERALHGRKVVFYFTEGSRFNLNSEDLLSAIIGAANKAGVSIYTVDTNIFNEEAAQGLLATMALGNQISMGAARVSAPQAPTGPQPPPADRLVTPGMRSMITSQFDRFETRASKGDKTPLADLAAETDGGHIPAGGNPKKIVRQMLQDLSTYYEISYVPPFKEYDGKFRSVTIKPNDRKIQVHSRSGYYAVPPQESVAFKLFEAPLLKVFDEAQLPSDVKFESRVLQLGDIGGGDTSTLVVQVPVSELATHDDPNTNLYSLHAAIVARIKDKAGNVMEHFSEDVPRHGALDTKDTAAYSTVSMQRYFLTGPGEYTLEAAVVDRNSGKIGATRATFVVPPPAAGSSLSDLVLVQRMDPFPGELDATEPMRYGDRKIFANVGARMAQGVNKIDLFSIVHAQPQGGVPARLELTVMRNNEAIAQVPLQLRSVSENAAIPYVASIQAGKLPAGDYQLIETLTQGEKTSEKSVTFHIEGPKLATATVPDKPGQPAPINDDMGLLSASKLEGGKPRLVITSLPEGSVPPPSTEELNAMAEAARKHSLKYSRTLPNFVCIEVTSRSVDPSGRGAWKHRDSLAELLRYVDSVENRTLIEHNGERTSGTRNDLDSTWPLSVGEFGGLLNLVFKPESKTDFAWKGAATLGDSTVQVLSYKVLKQNASMSLNDGNQTVAAGFHGLVYVDSATGGVRRVTLEADNLPRDFSIHGASMNVDYDYVTIGAHDYLMPIRATVALRRGKSQTELNEMAFRGYRRYSSQTRILTDPVSK